MTKEEAMAIAQSMGDAAKCATETVYGSLSILLEGLAHAMLKGNHHLSAEQILLVLAQTLKSMAEGKEEKPNAM